MALDIAGLLLASLLNGISLGAPIVAELARPAAIESLAASLDPPALQRGLAARQEALLGTADDALAAETLALVTPLADRLGLARDRAELEDASFRTLEPTAWAALRDALGPAPDVDRLVATTEALLAAHGIDGVVTGRTKSLYSLHQKMQRKDVTADAITDRTGLRVRVDTVEDCYRVRALLHDAHAPLVGEQDDYIASPKASGYRSLHTAVRTADGGHVVEFQVRTHAMHAEAESGPAAHWRYKLAV